ncbi:MAG TPA: hypothetical protein GX513_07240 [Firmicutes bacterium]|nr:hypothetical protein [Bacillota bacterium]
MLYARALLLRNCGRFTHVSSDYGSQYHTHAFVTSEALHASLTREITWRRESKFVDLEEDAKKSGSEDYFFCDYDVKSKPLWFTPGVFVDEQFRMLPKQRGVVDKNDFNVVDEGYPGTGGGDRAYSCPTYGRIESVLPGHRLLTCALSPRPQELEGFTVGQTFLLGKKRTMFQLVGVSNRAELVKTEESSSFDECQPIQIKLDEVRNFREYEVLASTARYLLVRGTTSQDAVGSFVHFGGKAMRRILPAFWVDQVKKLLTP